MRISFVVLVCILASFVVANRDHLTPPTRFGAPVIPCATEDIFQKQKRVASCTQGVCDQVAYRDSFANSDSVITLRAAIHVMQSAFGAAPNGVGSIQVSQMIARMNENFGAYGLEFETDVYYHNDANYYCIPAYSGLNQKWLDAINNMKSEYAVDVGNTLNIFISCQYSSVQGTLFGIGTFPWDSAALTATGGLWLNSISVNETAQLTGDITLEHEAGHCFGLWHTFHGSDEVLGCNLSCEELPHGTIDPSANEVGDLCSDTPATPRNYACSNPSGTACNGDSWGSTDYTNYMGYGMDPTPCGDHFTDQQKARMHCWVCNALGDMVVSGCPA